MKAKWIVVMAIVMIGAVAASAFGAYGLGRGAGIAEASQTRSSGLPARAAAGSAETSSKYPAAGREGGHVIPGGSFAGGQVKSVSGDTIELSMSNEVLKIKVDGQTQFQKTVVGSLFDLRPGDRVVIQGERGADGTLTARSVQIGGGGFIGGKGLPGGQ